MGKSTIIGLAAGFGALAFAFILEEGNLLSLLLVSPSVAVFGTIGALLVLF